MYGMVCMRDGLLANDENLLVCVCVCAGLFFCSEYAGQVVYILLLR